MHITIGAAILILGLLFLATFPAGRKVLGVVLLLIVIGGVGVGYVVEQQTKQAQARNAAEAQLPCTSKEEGRDIPMDEWIKRGCAQRR